MGDLWSNIQMGAQNVGNSLSNFMQGDLSLFGMQLKMWMLIAAIAGIVLIALVIILVISGAKKKKGNQFQQQEFMMDAPSTQAEMGIGEQANPTQTEESYPMSDQIMSIGDEPTVNLEEQNAEGGIMMAEDAETTDLPETTLIRNRYLVQVQMHYKGMVSEPRETLTEGNNLVIGRGDGPDVNIHTNPSDTSVSHHHGVLFIANDLPYYRDESRNGTVVNGVQTLKKGEETQLPLQTRIQLDIGTHRVLLFLVKM